MDFRALRNNVERFCAAVRRDREDSDSEASRIAADFIQTIAMTHVGIYEELAGIRRALEHVPTHEEHS